MMLKNQNILVEKIEKVIKCPQGAVDDHCKLILNHFDNNKAAEIKKIVIKSDVYVDDY